jgi:hypothetical protein
VPAPSTCSLDDLRARHPELGFAIYAYEPGGLVTLEVLTPDGKTYPFKAETAASAAALAFPETAEPDPAPATPPTDIFT